MKKRRVVFVNVFVTIVFPGSWAHMIPLKLLSNFSYSKKLNTKTYTHTHTHTNTHTHIHIHTKTASLYIILCTYSARSR